MNRDMITAAAGVAVIALLITAGCGSTAGRVPREEPQSPATQVDPFEFGDEFTIARPGQSTGVPEASTQPETFNPADTPATGLQQDTTIPAGPSGRSAYRVQLGGVFENREEAERYADRARRRLETEITVEYRAPFYRVFAGSFASQHEAETFVRFLRQEGFDESRWVPVTGAAP